LKTQPQIDAEVINYITSLYKIFGKLENFNGSCYKFSVHLIKQFSGEMYSNSWHIITKIGNNYFDSNGKVDNINGYISEKEFGEDYFINAFKEYL